VETRLVMSPTAAKLFLGAMTENISRFETKFGEINIPRSKSLADDLFRPNNSPEEE